MQLIAQGAVMPGTFTVTESNSSPTSLVSGSLTTGPGSTIIGIARAGSSSQGVGQAFVGTYGSLILNADGSFVYSLNNTDPDTNVLGTGMSAFERFTYTYSVGGITATGTLVFQVDGVDEPGQMITITDVVIQSNDVTIGALERVQSTAEFGVLFPGLFSTAVNFINDGALLASRPANALAPDSLAVGFAQASGPSTFINNGLIEATGPRTAWAVSNSSLGPVINNGVIRAVATADSQNGSFPAEATGLGSYVHGETIINTGTIEAISAHGSARAMWVRSLNVTIDNSGFIFASSGSTTTGWPVVGIQCGQSDDVRIKNSGTIQAVSTAGVTSFGIILFPDSLNVHQYGSIINSGRIVADVAIQAIQGYSTGIHVTNSGQIEGDLLFDHNMNNVTNASGGLWIGDLQFGLDQDILVNAGTIIGNVTLGAGVDLYDGRGGTLNGFLNGGDGVDLLFGGSGSDQLNGDNGSDRLEGGGGADTLNGGAGADVFVYSAVSDSITGSSDTIIAFESGVDKIDLGGLNPTSVSLTSSGGYTTVSAMTSSGMLSIQVQGSVVASDIVTSSLIGDLTGTSSDDVLFGAQNSLKLEGFAGNDVLFGNTASNLIDGGAGSDIMYGGGGDDTYIVEDGGDRVMELAGGGIDTVLTWIDYSLSPYADNLTLLGSAYIGGLGNEGNNVITGNVGDNSLNGDDGDDTIIGGGGQDILYGGRGADVFVFLNWTDAIASQQDWIKDFERGVDKIDIGAINPISFNFSHFVNYWTGDNTTTVSIATPSGTTVLTVNGLIDETDFTMSIQPVRGSSGDDRLVGGGSSDWLEGNDGNDILIGLAGSDTLRGGLGNDRIFGGSGNDVLTGGGGADSFCFDAAPNASSNVDRIADYSAGDTIYLSASVFSALTLGTLSDAAFGLTGTIAQTPEQRIVYNPYSGEVSYDPDGAGGAGAVLFAIVAPGTQLGASSFQVYLDQADVRNDFNGDGRSDILWRDDTGVIVNWLGQANGGFADNYVNSYRSIPTSWTVEGIGDFNGDGRDDVLWRNTSGLTVDWLGQANGGLSDNYANSVLNVPTNWQVQGIGDFNGDGRDDVLWRDNNGTTVHWLGQANGGFADNYANSCLSVPTSWQVAGVGDFNSDGRDDILWRNTDGLTVDWLGQANGSFSDNYANSLVNIPTSWQIEGVGDFNGDGRDDILWRDTGGTTVTWLGQANGGFADNYANSVASVPVAWQIVSIGDFNGDGRDDILWRHTNGTVTDWLGQANGGFADNYANSAVAIPNNWHVQAPDIF
jgi:VCBS repeat-containing protein